ncbi:MAG: hypothetical protein MUD04_10620 [Cyanobium sp. Prado107]|jgi:hemerythrin|nr:hypothetical protein [Cyanobium sp. Prado107]
MAVSGAGAVLAPAIHSPARPWPRPWQEQEPLLERQHARLEALLTTLLQEHIQPLPPERLELSDQAEQLACRRLLWDLRLHLRLEERWLERWGALCPGHRSNHREAAQAAIAGFVSRAGSRRGRLAWLQELNGWFAAHRQGPDAMAYALARQRSPGPTATP